MKIFILTIIAALGFAVTGVAQVPESVIVKAGQQRTAMRSKLKIKFVAVTEDSRCPIGTNCIWAGNARVKFEVINKGGGRKTIEVNTSAGPKGDQFDGWAIELVSLTPAPRVNVILKPKNYVAKFTITRLQR